MKIYTNCLIFKPFQKDRHSVFLFLEKQSVCLYAVVPAAQLQCTGKCKRFVSVFRRGDGSRCGDALRVAGLH